jgi:hypothetical protein
LVQGYERDKAEFLAASPERRDEKFVVTQQGSVAARILQAVRCAHVCYLDDLELRLPDLTWNQVFLEIDRLSRTGQVRVTAKGRGVYMVRLPNKESRSSAKPVTK